MSAARRRHLILDLLRRAPIPTQHDLSDRLAELGLTATQTTLSRDLAAIGAIKTPAGYQLPGTATPVAAPDTAHDSVLATAVGGTTLVLRTPPAHAHPVARWVDDLEDSDVLGTIAGDDTVFVAVRSAAAARRLSAILQGSVKG